jgi:hypothetical protein
VNRRFTLKTAAAQLALDVSDPPYSQACGSTGGHSAAEAIGAISSKTAAAAPAPVCHLAPPQCYKAWLLRPVEAGS